MLVHEHWLTMVIVETLNIIYDAIVTALAHSLKLELNIKRKIVIFTAHEQTANNNPTTISTAV
jgi:hypothetical protein